MATRIGTEARKNKGMTHTYNRLSQNELTIECHNFDRRGLVHLAAARAPRLCGCRLANVSIEAIENGYISGSRLHISKSERLPGDGT